MASIDSLKASDGSGNASVATVQNARSGGATTIIVDTVQGINTNFHATMGTPHTFEDPVTGEEITIISEATAVDFKGHVDGSNLEIDEIAAGYTDNGSEVGDIIIIKPTTQEQNELAEVLEESHNDDGSIKREAIDTAASDNVVGLLANIKHYTYTSPDIFINGVDQDNASNSINWTKPTGLKFVIVEAVGGGGGGGGSAANGATGGGGGGGGYARKKILAADLGATETVTVGTGGAAGGNGGNGTASTFGSHISGGGGSGGQGSSGSFEVDNGGVATGGDLNIKGGSGAGRRTSAGGKSAGGHAALGFGHASSVDIWSGGDTGGLIGAGYGAGGGGGFRSSSTQSGAAGTNGIVIVHEFF